MMEKKTHLKLFHSVYVSALYRRLQDDGINGYLSTSFPDEMLHPKGETGIWLEEGFSLDPGKDRDFENSKALYEALKGLNETQASDPRLWTYLTHVTFREYMQARWPLKNLDKARGRIVTRYFLKTVNIETLTRNGISRLWWYAHITYDPQRNDPYELTRILLGRGDRAVALTERVMGSNPTIRTAILEFINNHPEIGVTEKTRALIKKLNLIGGVRNLPLLEKEEIICLLGEIASTL